MMGHNDKPRTPLFYSFDLDDPGQQDRLLRKIDRFLDLSDLRQRQAPYYSHTGRPSVDPELMMRLLIIEVPAPHAWLQAKKNPARGGAE